VGAISFVNRKPCRSAILRDLIAFYGVFEGVWFYTGFAQILSLGRPNKMVGVAEQYQYVLRDESLRGDGPQEGKEFLRDPRHQISKRRFARLGLRSCWSSRFAADAISVCWYNCWYVSLVAVDSHYKSK
jgi:ribonucleotide reductase beta subunit family protein with ferritin-like domain